MVRRKRWPMACPRCESDAISVVISQGARKVKCHACGFDGITGAGE